MALTRLQRAVCRLLAEQRIRSGESYVAGGVALNELLGGARVSLDIDLFHDTEEAVEASWAAGRSQLESAGYSIRVLRQRPGFAAVFAARCPRSAPGDVQPELASGSRGSRDGSCATQP